MNLTFSPVAWRKLSACALLMSSLALPPTVRAQVNATPTTPNSGLPEESLTDLVNQMSDSLATKIQGSSCPDMVQFLDQIKAASTQPVDPDSVITKVLADIKTNPKLKAIVIQKLSEPLLTRMLDCNMVPVDLLSPPPPSP
jgi:hypothetical protein